MNKPIEFTATSGWNDLYGGLEASLYINMAKKALQKYPVDMLVFEYFPNKQELQIRLAGYDFNNNKLDETTIVFKTKSLEIKKFWLKLDDYEDKYVGTFLFPSEY